MTVLTEDMKRVVLEQRLGFHATVCPDGTPNLSPKGTTTVYDDDHLVFADLRSPQTIANLERNPAIEVNVVDPLLRKGYRFKGTATVHRGDDVSRRALALLRERDYAAYEERVRAVVLIRVERAEQLTSPAYDLPETSEEDVLAMYEEHYRGLLEARRARRMGTPSTSDGRSGAPHDSQSTANAEEKRESQVGQRERIAPPQVGHAAGSSPADSSK